MVWMLVFYLLLACIGLSFFHSYRILRRGGEPGALVDTILEGRREKKILFVSGGFALGYAVIILLLTSFSVVAPAWVVLRPFLYLVVWTIPRVLPR